MWHFCLLKYKKTGWKKFFKKKIKKLDFGRKKEILGDMKI